MSELSDRLRDLVEELRSWKDAIRDSSESSEAAASGCREIMSGLGAGFGDVQAELDGLRMAVGELQESLRKMEQSMFAIAAHLDRKDREERDPLCRLRKNDPVGYSVVKALYEGSGGDALRSMPLDKQVDLVDAVVALVKNGTSEED